ncbi:MAG: mitochondrial fission ELM1 family protein [Hyphomicrobiales bacterium]|nr:mitochondrial fission ELM1 family protein [Hyphomicrobiales bacterium]
MAKTREPQRGVAAAAGGVSSCWLLTDGKIGDEVHCLGIAEALGLRYEMRRVAPRLPWVWLMPWGPIDPRERPERPGSPIAPPYPDLLIASGRRAVPYLRYVKRASQGRTFTVFLKGPRSRAAADVIWVPEHDSLRGDNVLVTLTSPHRVSRQTLEAARKAPPPEITALPRPRIAVLLGGNSGAFVYNERTNRRLAAALQSICTTRPESSFMVTPSRRTPPATLQTAREVLAGHPAIIWDGTGENPYIDFLAHADFIVAPADSINMVGEAVATGASVYIFRPEGGGRKVDRYLAGLRKIGAVRDLDGPLQSFDYEPIDATPLIAEEILRRFAEHDW